jgi:hypothetical protein
LNDNNLGELARHAHKSVDAAGMIGALSFQQTLHHVERLSKAKDTKGVADAIQNILMPWSAIRAALNVAKS